jgi:hypothetical protein
MAKLFFALKILAPAIPPSQGRQVPKKERQCLMHCLGVGTHEQRRRILGFIGWRRLSEKFDLRTVESGQHPMTANKIYFLQYCFSSHITGALHDALPFANSS